MSANTKIILIVIIFLLLLFVFVMPASPQNLECYTSPYTAEPAVSCGDSPPILGEILEPPGELANMGIGITKNRFKGDVK